MIKTGSIDITQLAADLVNYNTMSNDLPQLLIDSIGLGDKYRVAEYESLKWHATNQTYILNNNPHVLIFPDGKTGVGLFRINTGGNRFFGVWYNGAIPSAIYYAYTDMGTISSPSIPSSMYYIDYVYNTETQELILSGHNNHTTGSYCPLSYIATALTENGDYVTISPWRIFCSEGEKIYRYPMVSTDSSYPNVNAGFYPALLIQDTKRDAIIINCYLYNKNGELVKFPNLFLDFIRTKAANNMDTYYNYTSLDAKYKYHFLAPNYYITATNIITAAIGFREEL